jgi:type II secretory pathway component PulK
MKNIQIIIQIAPLILSVVAVVVSALAMRWAYEIRRIERRRAERVGQLSAGQLYRLPPDRLPPRR